MTPAEQRLADLIARWLASIELHLKYAELDDARYWQVQPWPKHERPSKWVLEVAKQKVVELKNVVATRRDDNQFAESLENMAFLANLVGLQHIQRFIPLATESTAATVEAPAIKAPAAAKAAARADDATREMPKLKVAAPKHTPAKAPKAEAKKSHGAAPKTGPVPVALTAELQDKIVADAVRLLKWGKQWHELADTIARIAERPPAADIRKVLRAQKAAIESKVGKGK